MRRAGWRARRMRRAVLISAVVVVAGAGAAAGIVLSQRPSPGSGGTNGSSTTGPPTSASTTSASTTPPTTVPPLIGVGTYQVATTSLAVTDTTVPAGSPPRSVPTEIWYPAAGAQPDRAHAPYPLLVFSQGFDVSVVSYTTLLTDWASAGFVVAAPTYPDTDPKISASTPPPDRADLPNHPADLRAVLAAVTSSSKARGADLSGLVDPTEVGLVGQSDGGDVSLAVAADTCCRYPGVKAVATLSGAEYANFPSGQYFTAPTPPILVVQGNADAINPPVCSAQVYDAAPAPKYYLDLLGAAHLPPYTTPNPWQTAVIQVTTDFFEAELAGRSAALAAMQAAGNVTGAAALSDGPTAPPATGTCPTAP